MSCDSGKLLGSDPLVTDPIQRTPFDPPTIVGGLPVGIGSSSQVVRWACDACRRFWTTDAELQAHKCGEHDAIVRDLAERGPFDNDEQGMCATCPPEFPQRWGMNNQVPAEHDPACLWRRARELYPQPVVS